VSSALNTAHSDIDGNDKIMLKDTNADEDRDFRGDVRCEGSLSLYYL